MPVTAATTGENRQMPWLWRHLLKDSFRLGWLGLVLLFLVAMWQSGLFLEGKPAAASHQFGSVLLNALAWGSLFAFQQYPSYKLLSVLPLSRTRRGRLIWAQHVLVAPAVFLLTAAPFAAVQFAAGDPPSYTLFEYILVGGLAVPPAFALLSRRPPPKAGTRYLFGFVAPAFLGWTAYKLLIAGDAFLLSVWPLLMVGCAAIVAVSWWRAPRLAVDMAGPRASRGGADRFESLRRWLKPDAVAPLKPGLKGLHPFWRVVLVEPLRFVPLVILSSVIVVLRSQDAGLVTSLIVGFLTLSSAAGAGMLALQRARVMRSLPVTTGQFAGIVMATAFVSAAYLAVVGAVFVAAVAQPAAAALVVRAVLFSLCAGSFAPALFVRYGRDSLPMAVFISVAMGAVLFSAAAESAVSLSSLPLLLVAAPVCLVLGTTLLRRALRHDAAYQYKIPPLQAMMER